MVKTPPTATATVPLLVGRATAKGTIRHAERFAKRRGEEFHRPLDRMLRVSTVGLGTYLGECDDADDARYEGVARAALERGINVFEAPKAEGVPFTGFKMSFGAAFTQQFQGLGHANRALAPATDATGRRRGPAPDIGALEYRGP